MEDSKNELLKFCFPTENSIANLETGSIFCQHYSKYNDPFEFWNPIFEGIPDPEKEPDRFVSALEAWGMEGCPPNDEDLIAYFDECKDYQPPFKKMRDKVRIACFGSEQNNMLMWSHYADGLRGFCIVFDEAVVLNNGPEAFLLNVEYKTNPPIVDSFVYAINYDQEWYYQVALEEAEARLSHPDNLTDDKQWVSTCHEYGEIAVTQMRAIWQKVFAVKPLEWKYEAERRLIFDTSQDDNSPTARYYPPNAIKEIILGERMENEFRIRILSILQEKYPSVIVKTARRQENLYSIIIE